MSKEVVAALISACAGVVGGLIGGYASFRVQERRLRLEFQLQDSAQRVARALLADTRWALRSFRVIRHHLGGFGDSELRQILVRSGAVRFMARGGEELWGLVERNRQRLGVTRIDSDPENLKPNDVFDDEQRPVAPNDNP